MYLNYVTFVTSISQIKRKNEKPAIKKINK